MYKALFPWAIGVHLRNLQEAIAAAKTGGFQGVEFNPNEVADLIAAHGVNSVNDQFAAAGVKPAEFGLPTDWRTSDDNWRAGLKALPRQAEAAAAIGCRRTATWILPGDNSRPYEENRRFHIERFRPIAALLADHGISLGLEFIGPKTLRDTFAHPFIYRMQDMLAMGEEIGPNVGLLLDCWHWYTSGGSVADLRALRPEQVVYVHVNDAPAGVDLAEQVDNVRALPGETGVIDIVAFLQTLQSIGYNGPVTPEPFKKELDELPSDEARLKTVGAAMDAIFKQAGLPTN
jgi:sugar phosphate isomerase/epimerase